MDDWTLSCHTSWRRVCSRVHSPTRGNRSVAQQHEIMNDRPVRNVLIIVAMEQETMPLVKRFDLKRCPDKTFLPGAPFVGWSGNVGDIVLRVVWCGRDPRFGGVNNVATTAAAVATYASIAAFGTPELLVSAGTAGGFNAAGAAVGDCFMSAKCIFHARRIPSDGGHALEEYGFGHFRSPPLGALAARAGLKVGVISTSDSLDSSNIDLELMRSEGAAVKEMEAASVAWVCQTLSVPFVALKAITDIVDGAHATRDEFESNLHMASAALQQKVELVLQLIANTKLSEWAGNRGSTGDGKMSSGMQQPNGGKGAEACGSAAAATLPSKQPDDGRPARSTRSQALAFATAFAALVAGVALGAVAGKRLATGSGTRRGFM